MRSIVFLGLAVIVCDVYCRDLRGENVSRQLRLSLKDKRGSVDHPPNYSLHASSYATPVHSSLSSGYSVGGSPNSLLGRLGLHSLGSVGHGNGYSLVPSNSYSFGSGYLSPGLNHGSLGLQSASLGGHSAQSTYSVPNIASISLGSGNNGLFVPSKTGPVTFGLHGDSGTASASGSKAYSVPVHSSGGHGLSAYSNSGSSINLPVMLDSSHGSSYGLSLGSSGHSSGYGLPTQFISSSSSHPVTGGLVIASGTHGGSSSYNLPLSGSSNGIAALSSSGSHGISPMFSFPTSSGSHGTSALASSSAPSGYSAATSSGSYSSPNSQTRLPSGPSESSTYQLPISSGPSSSSGSSGSNSYANYVLPHSNSGSSYSSASSSNVAYTAPTSNYASSGSNYVSNPTMTYAGTSSNYIPTYSNPSISYGTASESHGAYSSVSPRYLGYISGKLYDNVDSGNIKYDTISYSTPDGKF